MLAASGWAAGGAASAPFLAPRTQTAFAKPPSASDRPGAYIFGYGSLIQTESRTRTVPSAAEAAPVVVAGIARGWFDSTPSASWSPTYLGAVEDPGAVTNGVLYAVSEEELEASNAREVGYKLTRIDPSRVTMLEDSAAPPDSAIWYYATTSKTPPTRVHPIVQSYVDVCIDGCLQLEEKYPHAKASGFAEAFIESTSGWKGFPWVNDRIYPWRPFIHTPRAEKIDALLQKKLGMDTFNSISLPGSW